MCVLLHRLSGLERRAGKELANVRWGQISVSRSDLLSQHFVPISVSLLCQLGSRIARLIDYDHILLIISIMTSTSYDAIPACTLLCGDVNAMREAEP